MSPKFLYLCYCTKKLSSIASTVHIHTKDYHSRRAHYALRRTNMVLLCMYFMIRLVAFEYNISSFLLHAPHLKNAVKHTCLYLQNWLQPFLSSFVTMETRKRPLLTFELWAQIGRGIILFSHSYICMCLKFIFL